MLSPKKTKYRKRQRRTKRTLLGKAQRGNLVSYGDFGMISLANKYITARQIEASRIALSKSLKRVGKIWIRIFPSLPYTKKAAETRMGSGKGSLEMWVAVVKPGTVLFEIAGVSEEIAKEAIRLSGNKLPIKIKFIKRLGLE